MTQYAGPTSDISNAWSLTGAATAWEAISDTTAGTGTPDDAATMISSPGASPADSCIVTIGGLLDPGMAHNHTVTMRVRKTGVGVFATPAKFRLVNSGGTIFVEADIDDALTSWTTVSFTLSAADVQQIVDSGSYGDLRFEFEGPPIPTGGTATQRISDVFIGIPDQIEGYGFTESFGWAEAADTAASVREAWAWTETFGWAEAADVAAWVREAWAWTETFGWAEMSPDIRSAEAWGWSETFGWAEGTLSMPSMSPPPPLVTYSAGRIVRPEDIGAVRSVGRVGAIRRPESVGAVR